MAQAEMQTGTVAGFFDNEDGAERAIDELISAGFTREQIGVALSSGTGTSQGVTDTTDGTDRVSDAPHGEGMWTKIKSFFGGNEAEPYAGERSGDALSTREITDEPGYGAGSDSEGYHSDAVHHSLSGLSVHPERASYFGGRLGQGDQGAVVTVSAGNRDTEAEAILKRNGADLGDSPTGTQTTNTQTNDTLPRGIAGVGAAGAGYAGTTQPDTTATGQQNIKLYGEVLRVHKDRVSRGEVNLRKEVITENQTIEVPVSREELVIERVAGTGDMVPDGEAFGAQTIRVPLTEEVASVDKQAFVREEIRVGKREVANTESFDETVRHEELKIDDATRAANTTGKDITR